MTNRVMLQRLQLGILSLQYWFSKMLSNSDFVNAIYKNKYDPSLHIAVHSN